MKTTKILYFTSPKYWTNPTELQQAYQSLRAELKGISGFNESARTLSQTHLITEPEDLAKLLSGSNLKKLDHIIMVPMSGAVQPLVLQAAADAETAVLYAQYIDGNGPTDVCKKMVQCNAAPTLMDTWSVIRRTHNHAEIALNYKELQMKQRILLAYHSMQGAKVLLVGNTEPWVVSNSSSLADYEKLGISVIKIEQSELAERYRRTTQQEAMPYYTHFIGGAKGVEEPTDSDILNACRMATALIATMQEHKANAVALACFNLLKEGTNSCLGVSYINDILPESAACEGDIDSAITMLMLKKLTSTKLWMANPGLHPKGIINFSHCTAPVSISEKQQCPYIIRNHHESGIGASLQVEYPIGTTVTACRVSGVTQSVTVHKGVSVKGHYESACRTQMYIQLDNFQHYINTALGCHQVFAFEDIANEVKTLAKHMGLTVL